MTNTKQWDAPAAQQLVRYEALTQLFEDILAVDDLVQIARRVATRWKYFANVACWRLVVVDAEGYLVIDGIRGEASLAGVQQLCGWDQYHWSRQRPCLLQPAEPPDGVDPPEHLTGRGITAHRRAVGGEGSRGGRQSRQEHLPCQHEPRTAHADERPSWA
jgi:hypothetical protein